MTKYPRVLEAAKKFNIGQESLFDILKANNVDTNSLKPTSKLTERMYKILQDSLTGNGDKTILRKQLSKEKIIFLESNLFETIKNEIIFKKQKLKTYFTDIQALHLCKRMSNSMARRICFEFEQKIGNMEFNLYRLHFIANKAHEIFGGQIITFILSLRQLKFKDSKATELFDYKKMVPYFPLISFKTKESNIKIAFFAKKTAYSNRGSGYYTSDVRLISPDFHEIGYVDLDGYLVYRLEHFRPQLSLFYKALGENNFELFSGVEEGICEKCKKKLTDPKSQVRGIGPKCFKHYGFHDI